MSIYAEKVRGRLTGRWISEVVKQGHRTRLYYGSYDEARLADSQLQAGLSVVAVTNGGALTLGWLLDQSPAIWFGRKDDQQAKRLKTCVELLGPSMLLSQVDTSSLHRLMTLLMAMKPKRRCERPVRDPKTLHRYLSSISRALRWAFKDRKLAVMPAIPWPATTEAPKRFFSVEDEQKVCRDLLEHGHTDHALVVRILSQTGLRSGELFKLKPEMVTNGFVLIGDWDGSTKSGQSRMVPITPAMEVALRALLERGLPTGPSLRRCLRRACERTGVDVRKTLHKLRHTTATRLVKGGVPLPVIQKYLGHKKIETTMGYISIESADLTQASEVLRDVGGVQGNRAIEEAVVSQSPAKEFVEITGETWRPRRESNPRTRICSRSEVADISAKHSADEANGEDEAEAVDNSWLDLVDTK